MEEIVYANISVVVATARTVTVLVFVNTVVGKHTAYLVKDGMFAKHIRKHFVELWDRTSTTDTVLDAILIYSQTSLCPSFIVQKNMPCFGL